MMTARANKYQMIMVCTLLQAFRWELVFCANFHPLYRGQKQPKYHKIQNGDSPDKQFLSIWRKAIWKNISSFRLYMLIKLFSPMQRIQIIHFSSRKSNKIKLNTDKVHLMIVSDTYSQSQNRWRDLQFLLLLLHFCYDFHNFEYGCRDGISPS